METMSLALSLAESATAPLLGKLGVFLAQEAELIAGVEDDVVFIADELKSMVSFLKVVSSRNNHHEEQVRTWIEQVDDMAYDAEDAIDAFTFHHRRWQRDFLGRFLSLFAPLMKLRPRHDIATDLQKIKLRARDVSERRARYYLSNIADNFVSAATAPDFSASLLLAIGDKLRARYRPSSEYFSANLSDPRLSPLSVEQVQPVGFDRHIDSVIEKLLAKNQPDLIVISLFGFAGLGKTTLAQHVFHSRKVNSGHFQVLAWIAVSRAFDTQTILRTVIRKLSIHAPVFCQALGLPDEDKVGVMERHLDRLREADLVKVIKYYLQDKRYLLVLDDILDIKAWEDIKIALPDSKNGSRVIATTFIEQVAKACSSHNRGGIYKIPPLSPDQSWELFCRKVFDGPQHACPHDLLDVSRSILRKCGGIPLAIVTIAGLVAAKTDKTIGELTKVHDQLRFDLDSNPTLEGLEQVLTVSYNDLPYHLKPCFLYLSVFPKYYKISKKRLVRRWVAEGLASERYGMSAEQVARVYFNELIKRGLLMPSKIGYDDTVRSCTVHNITMDVIVSISMEQNFVCVLGDRSPSIPAHGKIRRLSLHETSALNPAALKLSHIRSLTTFGDRVHLRDYGNVRLLRVLDLDGCKSLACNDLKNISKLFLLNFLYLRNSSIIKLPDSIGDLHNLQVLDVRGTFIEVLPTTVVKLKKLAHLLGGNTQIGDCLRTNGKCVRRKGDCMRMPRELGKMKNLLTLRVVDGGDTSNSHVLREIGKLTQLEKLDIDFYNGVSGTEESAKKFCSSLSKLNNCLRSLKILGARDQPNMLPLDLSNPPFLLQKTHLEGSRIERLPTWFACLSQITKIVLRDTLLKPDAMEVLKSRPALLKLVLGINSFAGSGDDGEQLLIFDCDGFTQLRFLHVESLGLRFQQAALPNLEMLTILKKYSGGESISGLGNLHKLWTIRVDSENEAILQSMLKSEVDRLPNSPKWIVLCAD